VDALDKLVGFLGRHFGPSRLALLAAAWILALGLWGTLARHVLPLEHKIRWEIPLELRAPLYAKFDSGWYLSIMEWGYGPPPPEGKPSSHAFFPLYPMTAKVLHKTFAIDGFHAGLIVTYACFFLALPLFWREGVARLGEEKAWEAVVFLLVFPVAFFFCAVYAESMFLLFALLAFRDARAGRTATACLWAALLGLTRASAVAVGPALFLAALESKDAPGGRRWGRALAVGATPIAAVVGWIYGMGWAKGEPELYFRSMRGGWHRAASSLTGASEFLSETRLAVEQGRLWSEPIHLLELSAIAVVAVLSVWLLARRRWSDAAWAAGAVALPISTGLPGGIPRFLLVVYPIYFAMAEATERSPWARRAAWLVSCGLLLWASARFVNWYWVS
jgi:hypothetical protein